MLVATCLIVQAPASAGGSPNGEGELVAAMLPGSRQRFGNSPDPSSKKHKCDSDHMSFKVSVCPWCRQHFSAP